MCKEIDARLSQIPLFDRKTIPPSRPAVPGARRRVAVKEGRLAIAKRREASLRATRRLATLGEGGRAFGHASDSYDPYTRRATHVGGPTPNPSTIGVMINPGMERRPTAYSSTEPIPLNRA
jgi:hypothetical protein